MVGVLISNATNTNSKDLKLGNYIPKNGIKLGNIIPK